ncbi:MAG: hypothetical protein IT457_21910 [Planctomycetes bacterium]|nr:hypothetical protein [Planctomycetota bacterium]
MRPPSDGLLRELVALLPALATAAPAAIPLARIDLRGPDALDFAQRIAAQDLAALADLHCAPTAFLTAKGKLVATALAIRDGDGLVLAVPLEQADELAALLERYHFSEKLTIARAGALRAEELVGLAVAERLALAPGHAARRAGALVAVTARGGVQRALALADAGAEPLFAGERLAFAWREGLRIAAGDPRVGVDTDERTLALEAGLDDHLSTTKGCYVGQEIVARIHSYGHVNRRLVRLRIDAELPLAAGASLRDAELGEPIGRVTSAVALPGQAITLALGWLPEAFLAEPAAFTSGAVQLAEAAAVAVQVAGLAPAQTASA